ncbi:MAG: ATP/GTP-binding protein [Ilumatobacteraceae bacterium]
MAGEHEHTFKILVTGPFAAGKTSLIQAISQSPVVTTEVATSGEEAVIKANTTVAMDFGTFALSPLDDGDELVHLLMFGTPGQERFRFMTDILKADVDVVTFVVDARAPASYQEARGMLALVMTGLTVPLVIAVNRCDDPDQARAVADYLGAAATVPAIPCQLIDPESGREVVAEVLVALLQSTDLALATQGGVS